METICQNYAQYQWACGAGKVVVQVGAILASVGLLRGATNSPWPTKPDGEALWKEGK